MFFEDLDMRRPDISLGVGSGSHAQQTARVLEAMETILVEKNFDTLVVVGDVNSTMAASLAAAKLGVPIAHVEAGLRSFDRAMPEEINRIVTDSISDYLLVSEPAGCENLKSEGHDDSKVKLVGNIMIDTLRSRLPAARSKDVPSKSGLEQGEYAVVTLHRPSNVDQAETLGPILDVLLEIADQIPVVFPIHPRTRKQIREFGLEGKLKHPKIILAEPMGYLDFLSLTSSAKLIITDSGGLQEESTALDIPCLTMRENTERPLRLSKAQVPWSAVTQIYCGSIFRMLYRARTNAVSVRHCGTVRPRIGYLIFLSNDRHRLRVLNTPLEYVSNLIVGTKLH